MTYEYSSSPNSLQRVFLLVAKMKSVVIVFSAFLAVAYSTGMIYFYFNFEYVDLIIIQGGYSLNLNQWDLTIEFYSSISITI